MQEITLYTLFIFITVEMLIVLNKNNLKNKFLKGRNQNLPPSELYYVFTKYNIPNGKHDVI